MADSTITLVSLSQFQSTYESRFKKARFMKDSWFKKDCCYNWFFSTHGASLHRAAGQKHDDDAATNLYSRHVKIRLKFKFKS